MENIKFRQIGENGVYIHFKKEKEIFILEENEFLKLLKEYTMNKQ